MVPRLNLTPLLFLIAMSETEGAFFVSVAQWIERQAADLKDVCSIRTRHTLLFISVNRKEVINMTKEKQAFDEFQSVPNNLWLPLFELLQQSQLTIEQWKPEMALKIYKQLEHPNWAPWLEASPATIAGRATVFPEGHLLIKDHEALVASLSMNRINWDGNIATLPTWDQIAGFEVTDYSETFVPDGNTLVMMSMNVVPESKGQQLPSKMIEYVKLLAQEMGVEQLIGSFRPSGYGLAKKQYNFDLPFWQYCNMKKPGSEKPVDPWLRSLWWSGMQMLQEDTQAMHFSVSVGEFEDYKKTYKPEVWIEIEPGIWECEEVGVWTVDGEKATYLESNVWGVIPHK